MRRWSIAITLAVAQSQQVGWKVLDLAHGQEDGARQTQAQETVHASAGPGAKASRKTSWTSRSLKKKTRPPKRFTEATLLTAMETAGQDAR